MSTGDKTIVSNPVHLGDGKTEAQSLVTMDP